MYEAINGILLFKIIKVSFIFKKKMQLLLAPMTFHFLQAMMRPNSY